MRVERGAFERAMGHLERAAAAMQMAVPPPRLVELVGGHKAYRYVERTIQQALVLKVVRTVSALRALAVLAGSGLPLDAGATMRGLDEIGTDIMFLAGPHRTGQREPRHDRYLEEFFQEEFDTADPITSTQRRNRVSRADIRAYVARTYAPMTDATVSFVSEVFETIESTNSGYVHGAAVHVLDVYDGTGFIVPIVSRQGPAAAVQRMLPGYVFRAFVSLVFAAHALGLPALGAALQTAADEIPGVEA